MSASGDCMPVIAYCLTVSRGVALAFACAACQPARAPVASSGSAGASPYPPSHCPAPTLPADADQIDRFVVSLMRERHVPGLSLVVVESGQVRKLRSYGYADLEWCTPATDDTLFGIGSIAKQLTAAGALTLVRDGKLDLDDPIVRFLPEGKGVWDGIRVRHLLAHTSGIPDYCHDDEKYPSRPLDRASSPDTATLVTELAASPLNFRPGADWAYSNSGYLLLSVLIERVAQQPFAAFMQDRVFAPLGMKQTRYYSPLELIPNRAVPYHVDGASISHGPFISDQFTHWGDAGVITTGADLGRWLDALGTASLLPPALWQQMETPARLDDGSLVPYNFGLRHEQIGGHPVLLHSGTLIVGYSALEVYMPERHLGIAVISNHYGDDDPLVDVVLHVVSAMAPEVAPIRERAPEPDPDPALTAALVQRLRGADVAHGALATTAAMEQHDSTLPMLKEAFAKLTAPDPLRFVGCVAIEGTPAEAYGARVARQCMYQVDGSSDVPGLIVWLTPAKELAGVDFW